MIHVSDEILSIFLEIDPDCHCPIGSLKAIPLEKKIMRRLQELVGEPKVVSIFLEKAKDGQSTSAIEARIKKTQQLIDQNQEKIEKLYLTWKAYHRAAKSIASMTDSLSLKRRSESFKKI